MKLSESNKPPGTHILYISDFSCKSFEVSSVMWPRPLYVYVGILALFILQHKCYNLTSDASNIVLMHCCHASLPYFCIFYFVWRHSWCHKGPFGFGSSAFFVNNFQSNWDTKSRKAPLCSHWAPESTDMRLVPLAQSVTLGDMSCDLTLTSGSTLTFTFTKQNVYHSTRLDERIVVVLEFWFNDHFWQSYDPKTTNLDLWVIDLTSEVTGWPRL